MKALKLLKERQERLISDMENGDCDNYEYMELYLAETNEAIKEIEDLLNTNCDNCIHTEGEPMCYDCHCYSLFETKE